MMFKLAQVSLYWVIQAIHPVIVMLCFIFAWTIILMSIWNICAAIRDGIKNAKQMHRIPCANCRFFTNNYHLKCPVHPKKALSDEAINCLDYEPKDYTSVLK